mmetsp:Transcript_65830/g.203915  ORF Transcript_65830/g.203915 Transcript_65830/m.203915 type:complete len:331 (-) Transcript_65830:39-1031(-)
MLALFLGLLWAGALAVRPAAASLLRASRGLPPGSRGQRAPGAADIAAFYINMPDRPARRAFAEAQYRALGIRAQRVEASASPSKALGNLLSWQRAVDACAGGPSGSSGPSGAGGPGAGGAGREAFCLVAEDDALYRPIASSETKSLEDHGYPPWGKANLTADGGRFFGGLAAAVAALPGGAEGPWTGLHLCTLGEMAGLAGMVGGPRVLGAPWPRERFTDHALYPGAPDALLLRRRDAPLYRRKLGGYIRDVRAKGEDTLIDLLQSRMYDAEDAAAEAGVNGTLRVFVAGDPQLCQHLTDYSNDPGVRSSVGDGASARSPELSDDSWASE